LTRDYVDDRKPDTLQASFHSEFCYGPKTLPPPGRPCDPPNPDPNSYHHQSRQSGTSRHGQGVRRFGRSVGRWFSCELPAACCQLPSDSKDSRDPITQWTQETWRLGGSIGLSGMKTLRNFYIKGTAIAFHTQAICLPTFRPSKRKRRQCEKVASSS